MAGHILTELSLAQVTWLLFVYKKQLKLLFCSPCVTRDAVDGSTTTAGNSAGLKQIYY